MSFDVIAAIDHLRKNAQDHSIGRCAQYTREAIEAGGLTLVRKASAKDYGDSLRAVGFFPIGMEFYLPGDVGIVQPIPNHPHGHMAMFDGNIWISDFRQWRGLYPGPSYREAKPAFTVYRTGILWDSIRPPAGNFA